MLSQEQGQHNFLSLVEVLVLEGLFQAMGTCAIQGAGRCQMKFSFLENGVREKSACSLPAGRALRAL